MKAIIQKKKDQKNKNKMVQYTVFHERETNIGKTFLKLLKLHFPRNNSFHKIFNKNSIKISYSCMRNISSIIASHNKSILRPKAKEYGCNCRNKESCSLQNQCLPPKVIYEATVVNDTDDEKRVYFGAFRDNL